MTGIPFEAALVGDVVGQRDELVAAVRDHAGTMARNLTRLQGGDYGREAFETDDGTWTLRHEK